MDETERQEIVLVREEIKALEERLSDLYAWRQVKILKLNTTMTRRAMGELFGVSNVRITNIVNADRLAARRTASG